MNTTILASCRINRFWRFLSRSKSFACSCSYRPFETVKRFQSSNGDNRDDKKSDEENGWRLLLSLGVLASSLVALSVLKKCPQNQHGDGSDDDSQNGRWVTWKDFVNEMLSTGEIKRLVVAPEYKVVFIELHPGAIVKGRQVTSSSGVLPKYYKLKVSSVKTFENNLRKAEEDLGVPPGQGVLVHYARGSVGQIISYVFLGILIYALYKLFKAKTGTGPSSMFTGIVNLGTKLPKSVLLLGLPGCGKTLLAKAVASEANVPFLATNGTEFIEMISGLGVARVRDLFKKATRRSPCMVYIDEIDALGCRRLGESSNMGNSEQEQTLNQLLVKMDGVGGETVMGSFKRSLLSRTRNYHSINKRALSTSCHLKTDKIYENIKVSYSLTEVLKDMEKKQMEQIKLMIEAFKCDLKADFLMLKGDFSVQIGNLKSDIDEVKDQIGNVKKKMAELRGKVIRFSIIFGSIATVALKFL